MQCGYFPRCLETPDLSLNAMHSMWPVNSVDRVLQNGHCYNGGLVLPFPVQQWACKEVVKQTILHHEAVFRSQIKELHRLYNRQRELMDEVKRNELRGHCLWQKTSSLKSTQSSFQVSSLPWLNPGCNQLPVSGVESNISCFHHVGQKVIQATCDPCQTKDLVKLPELLESKCKKVGRKILDLELPAEEYIDFEEEETCVEETVACMPEAQTSHLKTVLEGMKKYVEEVSLVTTDVNLVVQNGNMKRALFPEKTKLLADLNELITLEEPTYSVSNNFLCPVPGLESGPNLLGNTKENFKIELQNVALQGNEDPEACSNGLHHNCNGSQQDCLSDNYGTGKSSSNLEFLNKDVPVDELSISSEEVEFVKAQNISCSPNLDQGSKRTKRKRKLVDSECTESDFSSCQHTSNEIVPYCGTTNYESPLVLSSRRHTREFVRVPIVVQALPCFNSSAQLKGRSRSRSSKYTRDKSHHGENVSSNPEFQRKGNCSVSKENIPRKIWKGSVDRKFSKVLDLNSLSPCCSSTVDSENVTATDRGERLEADVVSKEENFSGCLDDYHSGPAGKHLSTKQIVLRNIQDKRSDFVCMDLNSCIKEDDSSSSPSSSTKRYLNAPTSPENKENSPPRGKSDEDQLETTFELSGLDDKLLQEPEKIAAEVIVSISSSQDPGLGKDIIKPFELLHVESLHWFARIVSSVRDDTGGKYGVTFSCKDPDDQGEHLSDGIDYFEAMTLSLKETNIAEYCSKTSAPAEEPKCGSPSQSQLRNGQTRRCRQQKKDFQNEILPSLASLSRYEVTEDLQAIGGIFEVTCGRRGSGARKAGRNSSPRMTRRRAAISSNVGNAVCSTIRTENSDLVARLRNLAGWTMVTKRRRGQRCRAIKPRLILGVA